MPVKAVLIDRDGTLIAGGGQQLVPGGEQMLAKFADLGVQTFVLSGDGERDPAKERVVGLPTDRFIHGLKGSKKLVEQVLEATGFERNEIVYLGGGVSDMQEASNNRLALCNAEWANPDYMYGLSVDSPMDFAETIEAYFLKPILWYFTVDGADSLNRSIKFRSLLDPATCRDEGITRLLKERREDFAENDRDLTLASKLVIHLLASTYLDGIHMIRAPRPGGFRKPVWCLYPGSEGGISPVLRLFEKFTARMFTMKYTEGLLERHTGAQSQHRQRMGGNKYPPISDQFNSVRVNPTYASSIKGNVVIVADDFSTGSNAMETSRNLLYSYGARAVIGLTVGKYGQGYTGYVPKQAGVFPPSRSAKAQLDEADLIPSGVRACVDPRACDGF